ncbi:MAG: hypothetical protein AAGM38_01775 [Pseudomonadota bacterium]
MGAMRRSEGGDAAQRRRRGRHERWAGRWILGAAALTAVLGLSACGGRVADPVAQRSDLDSRLNCAHLGAEKAANLRRMEDLRDERVDNRIRSVARVPGAIIGNPLSAIALADPSLAIYEEIDALEARNARIDELIAEKNCGAAPTDARSAAAAPLDPVDASLYEQAYEVDDAAEQALAEPQPDIEPEILRGDDAEEAVIAPVVQAGERDEATAERLAQETVEAAAE